LFTLVLDWLGEKEWQSYEDIEAIRASQEYKDLPQFLREHNMLPNNPS
jgi:hypothetical protein